MWGICQFQLNSNFLAIKYFEVVQEKMLLLNQFLLLGIFSVVYCDQKTNCSDGELSSKYTKICCNGETYNIGRDIKVNDSCNVPPNNQSLSYEDSIWLAYDCNVRIELNSTPLTLESYVNLMSDLPKSRQTHIWSRLTKQPDPASDSNEIQRINTIKSYRQEYFRAVREVCVNNMTVDQLGPFTKNSTVDERKTYAIEYAQPSVYCKEGFVPTNVMTKYFVGNKALDSKYEETCRQKMKNAMGNTNLKSIKLKTNNFCFMASEQNLPLDEVLNTKNDLSHRISTILPNFLSKSIKQEAQKHMENSFLKSTRTNCTNMQELVQHFKQKIASHSALKDGQHFKDLDLLANAAFFRHLFDFYWYLGHEMCQRRDQQVPK